MFPFGLLLKMDDAVPPYWTIEPKDVKVLLGHALSVHCRADGYPTPNVTWSRASGKNVKLRRSGRTLLTMSLFVGPNFQESVLLTNQTPGIKVYDNGTLHIRSARKTIQGRYICRALSKVGHDLAATISITVNGNDPASPIIPAIILSRRPWCVNRSANLCRPGGSSDHAQPTLAVQLFALSVLWPVKLNLCLLQPGRDSEKHCREFQSNETAPRRLNVALKETVRWIWLGVAAHLHPPCSPLITGKAVHYPTPSSGQHS